MNRSGIFTMSQLRRGRKPEPGPPGRQVHLRPLLRKDVDVPTPVRTAEPAVVKRRLTCPAKDLIYTVERRVYTVEKYALTFGF